jgi:protein TorT
MKRTRYAAVALALVAAAVLIYVARHRGAPQQAPPDPRTAITVDCFYGKYDARTKEVGFPARSLRGPVHELWKWNVQPARERKIRIGVLFPNREQNDIYWKAVRLGVQQQAALSGVAIELVSSDDYGHVEQHQKQFEALARGGVDAIILGAIHYRSMDTLIERATRGDFGKKIPVVAVVNDVFAPAISGKVLVSFFDMGRIAGRFVCDEARATHNAELSIALFPGPINSGWAPDSLRGFLSVIRDYPGDLRVITPQWGSPDARTQSKLIESVLESNQSIDYIVGNAVAASAAIPILRAAGREGETRIVSTYYNEALEHEIDGGPIEAAPWDQTSALGRIAVGMAVRILNGERPGVDFPFQVGPSILMKTGRPAAPRRAGWPRSRPEVPS